MVHYFNPGHEAAILNASKYYMPAANQIKMQQDLAYLPAWYASPEDYILTNKKISFPSIDLPQSITEEDLIRRKDSLMGQTISLWGLSPQSIHVFEQMNRQYDLHWQIPAWKEEYRRLSSRHTSRECLLSLIEVLPEIQKEILPEFHSQIQDIEDRAVQSRYRQLVKTPYSSSGRGLLWLPPGELSLSAKQILKGMLRKQSSVSIEKALNKQLDFSMHFTTDADKEVSFTGYSIFQTNARGAYEGSLIASQKQIQDQILSFIKEDLLTNVKKRLISLLKEKFAPFYQGCIGVDMLIYESDETFFLHPCLEINMRKSMGYLVLQLQKQFIKDGVTGYFFIDYDAQPGGIYSKHLEMEQQYPVSFRNNKIETGYLSLCPVGKENNYHAYILVNG